MLNGAAARTCQPGDQIIICNSVYVTADEITTLKPRVLTFDSQNRIVDRLSYSVSLDESGRYRFAILDQNGIAKPVPLRADL